MCMPLGVAGHHGFPCLRTLPRQVKKGPLQETSPMLVDISGIPMWTKVGRPCMFAAVSARCRRCRCLAGISAAFTAHAVTCPLNFPMPTSLQSALVCMLLCLCLSNQSPPD